MLEIMLPNLVQAHIPVQAPVPAPVVVNAPSVVSAPLVAAVVNAPAVVQAPAGVQQLVGQLQDLVVQNVAMEVEDDNEILKRLFLQRFGRALPEREKEKDDVDDVDLNMDLIDLTKDEDEMEVATSEVVQVVVKTEPIEAPIDDRRRSSRLGRLRKSEVIPEKEAPLAAESNVIADTDTDMAEDTSVNPVGSVNTESGNTVTTGKTVEQVIAEIDAAIGEIYD